VVEKTVYKIGGSCLRSEEDFNLVSEFLIREAADAASPVPVVISAMKGETDRLKAEAIPLFRDDPFRQVAHVATLGEFVSAELLQRALEARGMTVTVHSPWELDIRADGGDPDPFEAHLLGANRKRFRECIRESEGDFAVLPGYVGVHESFQLDGRPALVALGRGASDLIAVEAARQIGGRARLVKDAGSIYAVDRRVVPNARMISRMSSDMARRMLEYMRPNDQFIMDEAVRYANQHNVVIEFGSLAAPDVFSRVDPSFRPGEEDLFCALPMRDNVACITAQLYEPDVVPVLEALAWEDDPSKMIPFIDKVSQGVQQTLFFEAGDTEAAMARIAPFSAETTCEKGTLLTLIDTSIRPNGQHVLKAHRALRGIQVLNDRSSNGIIHFLVPDESASEAANALAEAFDLIEQ